MEDSFRVEQAICISYILIKESPNHQHKYINQDKTQKLRPVTHLEFHKALAKQLVGNFSSWKK